MKLFEQDKPKLKKDLRTLNVFDIDDTLFKTDARVAVEKDGKVVKILDPKGFNTYKLQAGEKFNFDQFRSGKVFKDTAQPINRMLDKAKDIVSRQNSNSESIILTARADLKHKEEFLQTFRDHGFPIDQVYVERAGNYSKYKPNINPSVSKAVILRKYINSGKFDRIKMWDDSRANLDMLFKLGKLHPEIEMIGYLVNHDGGVTRFNPNLHEELEIPASGMTFGRALMPQISAEKIPHFIKHLTDKGVCHKSHGVPAKDLKATQSEFDLEKVAEMAKNPVKKHPIIVSNDDYILDGHHRWLAQYNRNKNSHMDTIRVDLPILDLMRSAREFSGATYKTINENRVQILKKVINESFKRV